MDHWYETLNHDVLNLICQNLHPLEWISLVRCSKDHLEVFQYFMPSPRQSTYKTIKYLFIAYDIQTCEKLLLENIGDSTLTNIDFILYRVLEITKEDSLSNTVFYRLCRKYNDTHPYQLLPLVNGDLPLDIVTSMAVINYSSRDLIHWLVKHDSDLIGKILSKPQCCWFSEFVIGYAVKYNRRRYLHEFTLGFNSTNLSLAYYEIAKYDNWKAMWSTLFPNFTIMSGGHTAFGALKYKNYECLKATVKDGNINSLLHMAIDAEDYTAIKIIKKNGDIKDLLHNVFSWARTDRMICFLLEMGFKWTPQYILSNLRQLNKQYPYTKKIDYSKYFSDVDNSDVLISSLAPRELYKKMAQIANRKTFRDWTRLCTEQIEILLNLGFEVHYIQLVRTILAFNGSEYTKLYEMNNIMRSVQKYPQNIILSASDLYNLVTDSSLPEQMIEYALMANIEHMKSDIKYIEKAHNIKIKQLLFNSGFAVPSNFIEKNVSYLDDVLIIIEQSNKRLEINDEVIVSIAIKYPIATLERMLAKVKVVIRKSCKMDPSMQLKRNNKKASEVLRKYGL